jgi:hypothetical protein
MTSSTKQFHWTTNDNNSSFTQENKQYWIDNTTPFEREYVYKVYSPQLVDYMMKTSK